MPVAPLRSSPSDITHEVIESVVQLTEQRDELTLLRSLQNSIHEMLPEAQIAMACLTRDAENRWQADAKCPLPTPMFMLSDALVAQVVELDTERAVREYAEDGQRYLIASLGTQDERRKAILIRQAEWSEADRCIAQGMLNIYANFARVLFDSERDTLTGLYNRKKLEQKLSELLAARMRGVHRKRDENTTDYLAVFDIDHFKRINDTYGHLMGDEVLLIFAGLVRNTLRDVDWVFRYGGEEFVSLIKGVPPDTISTILERVRKRVQDHVFPQVGQVTVSIGFTAIADQALPPYVFEEADKALYYAKQQGRNRVCDYAGLVSSGVLAREDHAGGSVELF
ncbi:MAG: GGDEF domain-containing protein [Thiobacillus sp.]